MQNKEPHNDKYQRHGYWEVYYTNGKLWYIANYIMDIYHGYNEYHYLNGNIDKSYYAR